jgi:type IV fimbrial biogenesis protein FimT
MRQHGLTLLELLAGLVLVAIVTALGAPALSSLIDSQRRHDTALQMTSGLRMARVEAVLRSQPVVMQSLENDWSRGWNIFVDANQNQRRDADEPQLAERGAHRNVRVVGNGRVVNRVGFDSNGRLLNNANGTLAVCLKDSPASHYQIAIAVTGRVSLRSEGFSSEPCA